MRPRIVIGSIGERALGIITGQAPLRVGAVFERSFYVEAGSIESGVDFVCVGELSIGNGPLNAIAEGIASGLITAGLESGMVVTCHTTSRIECPGCDVTLDANHVRTWRPRFSPDAPPERLAFGKAVSELEHLISRDAGTVTGLGARELAKRISRFSTALAECARVEYDPPTDLPDCEGTLAQAAIQLLGLGPGLTPSGDDVLCGAFLALRLTSWDYLRQRLAATVTEASRGRTSALSRGFLAAAIDGLPCADLDDLLCALADGVSGALPEIVARLNGLGHSSGRDLMMGVLLVLKAAVPEPSK